MMDSPTTAVLMNKPINIDVNKVVQALHQRHPGIKIVSLPDDEKAPAKASVLFVDGVGLALMHSPTRLPAAWQTIASRAKMHWPAAENVFVQHVGHILIVPMGENPSLLRVARSSVALAGAVAVTHSECSGLIWDGTTANSVSTLVDLSRSAFAPFPDCPSALWVSLHPFRDSERPLVGVLSSGLRRFVDREVEWDGDLSMLQTIVTRARQFVAYLLENGTDVKDGDTIGNSAEDRIIVKHKISSRFNKIPVFSINSK